MNEWNLRVQGRLQRLKGISKKNEMEREEISVVEIESNHGIIELPRNNVLLPEKEEFNITNKQWRGPYVIVSKWCYPYGGGEDYLLDTMEFITTHMKMPAIWLCFTNSKNEAFKQCTILHTRNFRGEQDNRNIDINIENRPLSIMIKVNGGYSFSSLTEWLRLLNPSLVHHQGSLKNEVENACTLLQIPLLNGFHFWHHLVDLDPFYSNCRILQHIAHHKPASDLKERLTRPLTINYVASNFMMEVVKSVYNDVISPSMLSVISPLSGVDKIRLYSDHSNCKISNILWDFITPQKHKGPYVTMINVHEGKGGKLMLFLLQNMPNTPFLGVRTDSFKSNFDTELENEFLKHEHACLITRVEDVRSIYDETNVLLQNSEVDETFCRVVTESMASEIPTLCSDYGNIPNLMVTEEAKKKFLIHSCSTVTETYQKWVDKLNEILYRCDIGELRVVAKNNFNVLNSSLQPRKTFCTAVEKLIQMDIDKENEKKIALLTPWCDQGLGIQNRNYARILQACGWKVHVFGFLPYSRTKQQVDPSEWIIPGIPVVYSDHVREEISNNEIALFFTKFQIKKAILAETCWDPIFKMGAFLKSINVKVYAIPNIEIVRMDEILKHFIFHKILCNNNICQKTFRQFGFSVDATPYIGYTLYNSKYSNSYCKNKEQDEYLKRDIQQRDTREKREIHFLVLGGLNSTSRKQVHVVIESFLEAQTWLLAQPGRLESSMATKMYLTATSQKPEPILEPIQNRIASHGILHDDIALSTVNLYVGSLTALDIEKLYEKSTIVIQVSKHEGLGIGFYEALTHNIPVVTLNIPPHNEIISMETGWLLSKSKMIPNPENDSSCIDSALVDSNELTNFFKLIGSMPWTQWTLLYQTKTNAIRRIVKERHVSFVDNFCNALIN